MSRRLPTHKVLANGAIIQSIAPICELCLDANEEPEYATHEVIYNGKTLKMCDAHTEKLLDMSDYELEEQKGGWDEVFAKQK